jgi:WD40 repeat protein
MLLSGVVLALIIWHASDEARDAVPRARLARGTEGVNTVASAVTGTGGLVATIDNRGRAALWSPKPEYKIGRFLESQDFASGLAFSPDGRLLAVAEVRARLTIWEMGTVRPARRLPLALRGNHFVAFSPDGRTVAGASNADQEIFILDVAGEREPAILQGRMPSASLAFSPDGCYLVGGETADRPAVLFWDCRVKRQWLALRGSLGPIRSLAFSGDGAALVTSAAHERGARIWDVETGSLRLTTNGHSLGTDAVAIGPDRSTLATVGNDGKARLWDLHSGEERAVLDGHSARLSQVAFVADGRMLVAAGSNDNDLRIWDLAKVMPQRPPHRLVDADATLAPRQSRH